MPLQILWRGSSWRSRMTVSCPASTRRLAAAAADRLAPTMTVSTVRTVTGSHLCSEVPQVQHRAVGHRAKHFAVAGILDHDTLELPALQDPARLLRGVDGGKPEPVLGAAGRSRNRKMLRVQIGMQAQRRA